MCPPCKTHHASVPTPISALRLTQLPPQRLEPQRIIPSEEPGLLYLYNDPSDGTCPIPHLTPPHNPTNLPTEFLHFCWTPRRSSSPNNSPVDNFIIIPYDATFVAYPTPTGRIFILKFSSSNQRHFYWLQSKPEKPDDLGYFSERDREWGRKINRLLQGDEESGDEMDVDGDEEMEDVME